MVSFTFYVSVEDLIFYSSDHSVATANLTGPNAPQKKKCDNSVGEITNK